MKLAYSPSCERIKARIIETYPCFQQYFDDVEKLIEQDPLASSQEIILYQDKQIHARKKYIKTTFFSGLLPDQYLYLTLTYAMTIDNRIVVILVNLHSYID
jgi:hypothetical protein